MPMTAEANRAGREMVDDLTGRLTLTTLKLDTSFAWPVCCADWFGPVYFSCLTFSSIELLVMVTGVNRPQGASPTAAWSFSRRTYSPGCNQ